MASVLAGNSHIGTGGAFGVYNLWACRFTVATAGDADRLKAYITGATDAGPLKIRPGVWDSDGAGGLPGTRLAQGAEVQVALNAVAAWVTLLLTAPLAMVAAHVLWLGVHASNPGNAFIGWDTGAAGDYKFLGTTYSTTNPLPSPFGTPTDSQARSASIYAEGTPTVVEDDQNSITSF